MELPEQRAWRPEEAWKGKKKGSDRRDGSLRARYTRRRKARRWSRAKVKWEMSVQDAPHAAEVEENIGSNRGTT